MSKLIIKKGMSQEQRIAAIKKAADKFNRKIGRNHRVRRTETSFLDKYSDDTNIHAWTDSPKYLDEHYGDRVRDQNEYESYEGWN